MLRSAFTTFFRSFTRHPLYAFLNLFGLAFGIAVFITLSLLYHFETSYEDWTSERAHIYKLTTHFSMPDFDSLAAETMGGLLDELREDFPQTQGVRDWDRGVTVHQGRQLSQEGMHLVDPDFLTFFNAPMVAGNPATALQNPNDVVVSESVARKFFGAAQVVGRPILLEDADGLKTYTVSAVMRDLPENSEMSFDFMRRLTPERMAKEKGWHQWGSTTANTYLKFPDTAAAAAYAAKFTAFTDRHGAGQFGDAKPHTLIQIGMIRLGDIHLRSPVRKAAVVTLGLVGMAALALALINYVNLATARAGLRAREVAVRKVLGASPVVLRGQFLAEAILTLLLAFLLGLSMVELSLPVINASGGLTLKIDYIKYGAWLTELLGVVMAAGLLAAVYPAFALSAFRSAQVLAANRTPAGGRTGGLLREGLVIVQFTAVVVAFVMMAGFFLQIRYLERMDLGFARANLFFVKSTTNINVSASQRDAFGAALSRLPGVTGVTIGNAAPGDQSVMNGETTDRLDANGNPYLSPSLNWSIIGPNYFQVVGAHLLAGRYLDAAHGEDQMWQRHEGDYVSNGGNTGNKGDNVVTNAVISRLSLKLLHFSSPQAAIGQFLRFGSHRLRIVGVVDDMRYYSPLEEISPKLYLFDAEPSYYPMMLVRYQDVSEPQIRDRILKTWQAIVPNTPFEGRTVVENLDTYYKPQRDRSNLFDIGAGIGGLIGCIGLYGLAAFNASRRTREIGVRKVLGATRWQTVRLLVGQFLRPVLIGSLLAWPLAWLALHRWLSQFDTAIVMPLWLFPIVSILALGIAVITVAGVALAAASVEPGRALRHE